MSLDQLPDDLIAHIGTFMNDNSEFAKSQKRIHRVIMRYKLNKPVIEELTFKFHKNLVDGKIRMSLIPDDFGSIMDISAVGQVINSTRSIKHLILETFDNYSEIRDLLKELLAAKVRVGRIILNCEGGSPSRDVDLFVNFCSHFNNVTLNQIGTFSPSFYRDEVLERILPATVLRTTDIENYTVRVETHLTDRTLVAMNSNKLCSEFDIKNASTFFTVGRIATLVNKLLESADQDVKYHFGALQREQKANVARWMLESNTNPEAGFTIHELPSENGFESNEYSVVLKSWTPGQDRFIKFYA